ncbi:uncharacterized protein MYCFIDRAFT_178153 [Pseudocercospora fijiensis CIRAD86]|uniref:Uncharacterized protein n=1 Tax=Pseudocercospora fijiensis (strain CIRAD86) TaxID=383855 RepID=M3A4M8_PSEFD|nr:uncharacterized protein MYCFIDRAFT_178153 [Pseudocercospora fijiensis CIRAD86]EME79561.1 hypothetical protein MYCFIDRAFT_178153 [Pseudocercospora fijiensis CIRAD86]
MLTEIINAKRNIKRYLLDVPRMKKVETEVLGTPKSSALQNRKAVVFYYGNAKYNSICSWRGNYTGKALGISSHEEPWPQPIIPTSTHSRK